MTPEEIRTVYDASPFQPFRVQMANGKSVDVPHPDFMHLAPTGRRLIVDQIDGSFEIIDVLRITSLEIQPKNGSRVRRKRR